MNTRIYIGNLSARVTETDLEDEVKQQLHFFVLFKFLNFQFKKFGYVRNVWIARQPPGFAFVVMEDGRDAEDAIRKLDGTFHHQSLPPPSCRSQWLEGGIR